jgi:excisionase family DNA binding protein
MTAQLDPIPSQSDTTPAAPAAVPPLTVSIRQVCALTGLGPTSIWALIKNGRLEAVRPKGLRRTLIRYESLRQFLGEDRERYHQRRR